MAFTIKWFIHIDLCIEGCNKFLCYNKYLELMGI